MKNGVKNIQAMGYNGAHTVYLINNHFNCFQLQGGTENQPSIIELSDAGMSFGITLPHHTQSLELDEF